MQQASQTPVIEPRLLAATRELELRARGIVSAATAGLHPSRRSGPAREFSQYRAYQPGDEPRQIDWKMLARSDRYFLREGNVDTRVTLSLVLDATESMQHTGSPGAPRKFDVARQLVAAFALLAERQGDATSLHVIGRGEMTTLLTAGRRQPWHRIVRMLVDAEPAGRWPSGPQKLTAALRRAEFAGGTSASDTTARLTVVVTDGHESGGEIRASLAPLRGLGHEVLLVHLIAPDERDFPYRGRIRLEEWETGRMVDADAEGVRGGLLQAAEAEQAAWRRDWGGRRFGYLALSTDEPVESAVRVYLRRRSVR